MATPAYDVFNLFEKQEKYTVLIADDNYTKNLCYKLRYNIFAKELGASVSLRKDQLDKDRFDNYCQHLAVFDNRTNDIIATTRLLNNEGREKVGSFYSETEFKLSNIINPDVQFIEVGRTCIHPAYRRGVVLAVLWRAIADITSHDNIDYLIGCASIPLSNGDKYIASVMKHIHEYHYAPECLRSYPHIPLRLDYELPLADDVILPTLLKAYLKQGALICGEPYLDAEFSVADVFVLLEASKVIHRYSKSLIDRVKI